MRAILQRVTHASVTIDNTVVGKIGKGYLILLGIADGDTREMAQKFADKIKNMRIFSDENDKTNLSIDDVGGDILVVSQFTLYADCKKGNRPGFAKAGKPGFANEMYEYFISLCKDRFTNVQCGRFGADMKVELLNDGPFTILLDSDEIM